LDSDGDFKDFNLSDFGIEEEEFSNYLSFN
jgi:hypothetical protein